jgi:hypothetical protein
LQFWGKRNTGRVARGLSKMGVVLHSCISEHDHGKAMPDGLANVATGAITEGCANGHHLEAWDSLARPVPGAASPDSEERTRRPRGLGAGPLLLRLLRPVALGRRRGLHNV